MFVSLGWERGVASVPGRPPDGSGGGQRHQGGGSAGAAYTQEAAAGGAGSQCKTFHRPWGPARSQVPFPPYSFFFSSSHSTSPSCSPLMGCSSFLSNDNVDMRHLPEYCHIPVQCFLHVIQTVIYYHFNSKESLCSRGFQNWLTKLEKNVAQDVLNVDNI